VALDAILVHALAPYCCNLRPGSGRAVAAATSNFRDLP
jgi:hypothetical protein